MARDTRPVNWGQPGQTGVTKDGVPWEVPAAGPSRRDRVMQRVFGVHGTYMPVGARLIPARTPADVQERVTLKYGETVARLLDPGEELCGFIGFSLGEHIPYPPRSTMTAKVPPSPVKHWWMGGGWDTMAGQLVIAVGGSGETVRRAVWVRTDRRIVIMAGETDSTRGITVQYDPRQVGVLPGWTPPDPAQGQARRVDIAFADGSWVGLWGSDRCVPGSTEGYPIPRLIAELAGPPVTATVMPPLGRA